MKNLKIGLRLGVGFGFALMMMSVIAVLGVVRMSALADEVEMMVNDRYPKTVLANDIIDNLNLIARAMRNALLVPQAETQKELDRVAASRKIISERLEQLEKTITSDKGKERLKKVQDARAAYVPVQDQFMSLVKADREDDAKDLMLTTLRAAQSNYLKAVSELIAFQSQLMVESGVQTAASYRASRNTMIAISCIGLVVSILFALWIPRSSTRPCTTASAAAGSRCHGGRVGHM